MEAHKTKTLDDLLALPEDQKAELIDGEIVMMAPASNDHNELQAKLVLSIGMILKKQPKDEDFLRILTEAYTYHDSRNTFMHDVAAFWNSEYVVADKNPTRAKPFWVCEILSPSNWKKDTYQVFNILEQQGIPYYWVVSPMLKGITVYKFNLSSKTFDQITVVQASDGVVNLPPFTTENIDVSDLFDI